MRRIRFSIAACISIHVCLANAQESADQFDVELYEAPIAVQRPELRYPASASGENKEGWVELSYMVNPEGEAYEISVADHVGDDAFIDAAIEHAENTVFRAARLDDEIVNGSGRTTYIFEMQSRTRGARPTFASRYRRFVRTLGEEPQVEATNELAQLEELDIENIYEYAHLNMARFLYAQRYGTTMEQMTYLKRALGEFVARPESPNYFGGNAVISARRGLFQLQVANRYFGEAMETLELMRLKGDEEGADQFAEVVEQLESLKANDEPYGLEGHTNDNGSWVIQLFKDDFFFADLSGTIEELKLRCNRAFLFFEFDPEIQYNVSESAGECSLEVIGDPGTTFTLVQS